MAELSEEQLLLLDNLMYYDGAANTYASVRDIALQAIETAKNYDKSSFAFSGGFETSPEQMIEIANAILQDDTLCNLVVSDSINSDAVRATCFVDANGDATIAIRGTGGSFEAWDDNLQGMRDIDTKSQKEIQKFVHKQGEYYDNITITGHSKGGNLAQYATVVEGDKIDRCVSFDGQGFNDKFCEKYRDEIAANRKKIKSISGDKDIVNTLLNSIAGSTVYLETEEGYNAHGSYAMWKKNEGTIIDGKYAKTIAQNEYVKKFGDTLNGLAKKISELPGVTEEKVVDVLGGIAGLFLAASSGQLTKAELAEFYKRVANLLGIPVKLVINLFPTAFNMYFYTHTVKEDHSIKSKLKNNTKTADTIRVFMSSTAFCVRPKQMSEASENLNEYSKELNSISEEIKTIRVKGQPLLNKAIKKLAEQVEKESTDARVLSFCLRDACAAYEECEKNVMNSI